MAASAYPCTTVAKIEELKDNLGDLLHKDLEKVLLHVETNNAVNNLPENIFSKLLLADSINYFLPECNVIISNLKKRTDNQKTNGMCEKGNTLLKASNYRVLDISNVKEKHLGKRGLHLNA